MKGVKYMNEDQKPLKDSGERQTFSTGAVRDLQNGKGRYDLLPVHTIKLVLKGEKIFLYSDPLLHVREAIDLTLEAFNHPEESEKYILRAGEQMLWYMEVMLGTGNVDTTIHPVHGIFRVARVYEKGALKYAARNWEKGINLCRYLDSALRHLFQVLEGRTDEDHPAQAAWNLVSFVETKHWIDQGVLPKELDDMPRRRISETVMKDAADALIKALENDPLRKS
jgi:hypothetical protein